ncbi:MAG: hypothetical protein OK455_06240 [Thaumarchaeota archaeon]|nr:hypothetical protein [Nitrososphaerota archaeon]
MRAIIHSIHSQVPLTIAEEGLRFGTIISMDSHLDVWLGRDEAVYPEKLRIIVARTGTHAAFRHMTGGSPKFTGTTAPSEAQPRVVVVIPKAMVARHAMDVESRLPKSLRVHDQDESIRSSLEFLESDMGIEVFQSPPTSLLGLVRRTKSAGSWLLDVDVDYMHEMQGECYTRIYNPAPGVLQTMNKVVDFIEKSKPKIITISEAKVSAIRDKKSRFSSFIEKLKAAGYTVEERGIFPSDEEVTKGISTCREFYRSVATGLTTAHMDAMMRSDLERFQKEEEAAAKSFFRSKGYTV